MMEGKDWMSFFMGLVVAATGLVPILNKYEIIGFNLPLSLKILQYLVAAAGFYLIINSIIEITNSNSIGWTSFFIAAVIMITALLPILNEFGVISFTIPFMKDMVYQVLFVIEGIFLIIAAFAMEM